MAARGSERDDPWVQRIAQGVAVFARHPEQVRNVAVLFGIPPAAIAAGVAALCTRFSLGAGDVLAELVELERRLRQRGKVRKV